MLFWSRLDTFSSHFPHLNVFLSCQNFPQREVIKLLFWLCLYLFPFLQSIQTIWHKHIQPSSYPTCQGKSTCGTRIRQLSFSAISSNPLWIKTEIPKEDLEFTDMVAQKFSRACIFLFFFLIQTKAKVWFLVVVLKSPPIH